MSPNLKHDVEMGQQQLYAQDAREKNEYPCFNTLDIQLTDPSPWKNSHYGWCEKNCDKIRRKNVPSKQPTKKPEQAPDDSIAEAQ
jgi:hypothetical protein